MSYAIIYDSLTGNTELLAKAIDSSLPNINCNYVGEAKDNIEADFYFIGFWVDKGNCCEKIKNYLHTIHNKKIVLFGTCGFGGSEEYFNKIIDTVKKEIPDDNNVVSTFLCQGKMPAKVKERYLKMKQEKPNETYIDALIKNFDQSLTHPDEADLKNIRDLTKDIFSKRKNIQ